MSFTCPTCGHQGSCFEQIGRPFGGGEPMPQLGGVDTLPSNERLPEAIERIKAWRHFRERGTVIHETTEAADAVVLLAEVERLQRELADTCKVLDQVTQFNVELADESDRMRAALEQITSRADVLDHFQIVGIARSALRPADETTEKPRGTATAGTAAAYDPASSAYVDKVQVWDCRCDSPECPYCGPRLAENGEGSL